jgi:hypothetical protein
LELRQYGGEVAGLSLNLYPLPPDVKNVKISKGDTQAVIVGERLEQLRAVKINGKRAVIQGSGINLPAGAQNIGNGGFTSQSGGFTNQIPSSMPITSSFNPSVPGERIVVFEDPNERHLANTVSLELELEDNRNYQYPKTFNVSLARPAIVANEVKEIDAVAIDNTAVANGKAAPAGGNKTNLQFALSKLPIFPINASEISINVRNALTDYDFNPENISIETRIEKSQINASELPKATFEVLNWMSMRVSFLLNEQTQKFLGGKRLQFRIRDKVRGDSDWYTLRKTFARVPEAISVKCSKEMNGNCEMKGDGIDYVKQVSVDGGMTWYPQGGGMLIAQPTADGQRAAMIPHYSNKKLLQIRLIDFPSAEGLTVNDYNFINSVRGKR